MLRCFPASMRTRFKRTALASGMVVAAAGAFAMPAQAEMRVVPLAGPVCKVIGGGKFVRIPNEPGETERIDRRLIPDIRWMRRKYRIDITDGYALSGHSSNGEHPIGLALDIIPRGSSWDKIDDLAHRFEPRQNRVRPPMRWVGYDGDAGHGRGHHLHLSYSWSDRNRRNGEPVRVVYTRVCPGPRDGDGDGANDGGVAAQKSAGERPMSEREIANLAPVVPETHEHYDP